MKNTLRRLVRTCPLLLALSCSPILAQDWISLGPSCGLASIDFAAAPNDHVGYAVSVGRVFKTTDSGSSWTPLPGPQIRAEFVAVDKVDPARIYVHSTTSTYFSTDGGATWSAGATGVELRLFYAASPTRGSTLFATDYSFVHRSTDGGQSFQQISPISCTTCRQRAEVHRATGRLWVSTDYPGLNTPPWRMHYSDDDGDTWTEVATPGPRAPTSFGITTSLHSPSFVAFLDIDFGDAYIHFSEDSGQTWTTVPVPDVSRTPVHLAVVGPPASRQFIIGFYQTYGITALDFGETRGPLVFSSPDALNWTEVDELSDHELVELLELPSSLVAATGAGFYRGSDFASWSRSSRGINTSRRAYMSLENSPAPDLLTLFQCVDENSNVVPSRDGGRTFERGIVDDTGFNVAISPTDPDFWFHSTFTGPKVSTDAGLTWQFQVIPYPEIWFHEEDPGVIFSRGFGGIGIERSVDGGATFSTFFDPGAGIRSMAISKKPPFRIYFFSDHPNPALWVLDENGTPLDQHSMTSPGGGLSVVSDPQRLLFRDAGSLWRSDDEGATWVQVTGLPWGDLTQPVWDPHSRRLLIGTEEGLYSSPDGFSWTATGELQGLFIEELAANRYGHILASARDHGVWVYNDPVFFGDFETGDLSYWSQINPEP